MENAASWPQRPVAITNAVKQVSAAMEPGMGQITGRNYHAFTHMVLMVNAAQYTTGEAT